MVVLHPQTYTVIMAFRLNYISCVEFDVQNAISLSTFLKFYVFIRMHILQRPVITWMLQKRGRFVEYPRSNSLANRCSIAFCGRHFLWVEGWTSIVFIVTSSRSVFSHIIPQSLYPGFGGHEVHCSTQTTVFQDFSGSPLGCTTWSKWGPFADLLSG